MLEVLPAPESMPELDSDETFLEATAAEAAVSVRHLRW